MMRPTVTLALLAATLAAGATPAAASDPIDARQLLMDSVGFASVKGRGTTPALARFYRDQLVSAGFAASDIMVTETQGTAKLHLAWRVTGKAKAPPMALTGHMDVVEANPADWKRDPFTAVAEGGYIFGRGVQDNKFGVATMIGALARLKAAGFRPRRDIHLFLSGDEETDGLTSAAQAKEAKALGIEYMLNSDAGGGTLDGTGKPVAYTVQAAEKSYADFILSLSDPGGHSSAPGASNAIARMGQVAARIAAHRWPAQVNDITRAALADAASRRNDALGQAMARFAANPADEEAIATLRANPATIGQIGTTCVPTQIAGGHAPNALPQRVELTVNCRIFPGTSVPQVQAELARIADDPGISFKTGIDWVVTPASPLRPDVLAAVQAAVSARAPGLKAVPGMS
ncbi:M20/M25/M40 family metallo-hydrolase, partial [Sandarakinorhabdus rubra]|uniref:M20/M25/M40 family metallo-hydrolase n=1 Tax=Sandarakinorhabdus rubra TaxID=2672568 RepID=UPI0013DBEEC1